MSFYNEVFGIIITNTVCPYRSKPQYSNPDNRFAGYWCEYPDMKKFELPKKCSKNICPIKNEYGRISGLPFDATSKKGVKIIEHVWCLCCGHMFFCKRLDSYKCSRCGEILRFDKENMRYIVDK